MERLDLCHMLYTKTIGDKLYLAPIEANKLHRVLDIGTGNGLCTDAETFACCNCLLWQGQ